MRLSRPLVRLTPILFALCLLVSARPAAAQRVVGGKDRVAIVGDSITEQKLYSKYMEAYLLACNGTPEVTVFQFGWSGERADGFAARLENDFAAFKPTVVTLCYGMNDGSYQPYNEQIGKTYETNMRSILKKLEGQGIKSIVIGSPGAVDTDFFRPGQKMGNLPAHEAYNDNLSHLKAIDKKLADELSQRFANVHDAMFETMKKAKATLGTGYDVCGRDGFHPGPNGQLIMAYAFLKGLNLDGNIGEITVDLKGSAKATDGHKVIGSTGGKIEVESTRWPFCYEGDAKSSNGTLSIAPFLPFNDELNRLTLKVANLDRPRAKVQWGTETKEFSREDLTKGINLAAEFPKNPFSEPFAAFVNAVGVKQAFETSMIKSIITTFRGYPPEYRQDPQIQAAQKETIEGLVALQQALDARARKLLVPVKHTVTITPVE